MHIAIFSHDAADLALLARSLPAHDCHGVQQRGELRRQVPHAGAGPDLLIVDVTAAGTHLSEIVQQARELPLPLLLLATDADLPALTTLPCTPLLEFELKPLRRHAVAARVQLLLQRAYPGHDERRINQHGAYRFEAPAHLVHYQGHTVALTQKEFALALLLFDNLGRPLSRPYLQESIWGADGEEDIPTRTIDTHVSRVRNKLQLKPENGFRLSTVYGYGYQLERLDVAASPLPTA